MKTRQIEKLERQLYSETFLIGGWRRRRAAEALAQDGSSRAVRALARALARSDDPDVRTIARQTLERLDDWRAISAACAVWAETRHAALAALMLANEWVASTPPEARVLSALKVGELEVVAEGRPNVVEPLVQACVDADPTIAQRAGQALRALQDPETQETLCQYLIQHEHPHARAAAVETGYRPQDQHARALFFFLTEQWERYDGLDFDRRLLRASYGAAERAGDDRLQRRIREKLRAAGRADFLSILTGDEGARQDGMTPAELDVLTQTLIANAEWPALWRLVFDVPLAWSVRAVRVLARDSDGWQPETPEEAALLQELAGLAQELPEDAGALAAQLPPALLQARARVPGRINDVAFSPLGPHLAIGTGVRKVVVWDYARAQRERVLSGLGHSIGCVAFGGDGVLLAAERTNRTEVPCGIFRWDAGEPDDQAVRLGGHTGSVTVLIPLGREQVLSAGRDGEVVVWHTHTGQEVARRPPFPYQWPRTGAVSPDGRHAVFMHTGLDIVALSEMGRARSGGMAFGTSRSVVRAAAFVPSTNSHGEPVEPHGEPVKSHGELVEPSGHGPSVDSGQGHVIIAGCYNGEVVVYRRQNPRWYSTEPAPLTRHPGRAEGVAFLAGRGVVVTAGSEGRVRFIDWESRELLGEVEVPLGKVTSLRISPDGLFMALGNSEAQLSLWDLRALDARLLLEDAFAQAAPADLTALEVVLAQATLDPPLQRALQFVDRVLRHRFRFDIQVSEAPVMMMGEFDIEVE